MKYDIKEFIEDIYEQVEKDLYWEEIANAAPLP